MWSPVLNPKLETRNSKLISVALPLPLRQAFTYSVPEGQPVPVPGARVRVPFGERALTGVVLAGEAAPALGIRDVLEILDDEAVCPPDLLAAASRIAERFFTSTGEVLRSALPARLPAAGAVRYRVTEKGALSRAAGLEAAILDRLATGEAVRVADLPGESAPRREALRALEERGLVRASSLSRQRKRRIELAYLPVKVAREERDAALGRSRRGRDALEFLDALGRPATAAEIRSRTGAAASTLKTLADRGLIHSFEEERAEEAAPRPAGAAPTRFVLTAEQGAACQAIVAAVRERRYFPALLQGVTGSGKSEVYMRSFAAALEAGRGAVWLVPEIALTPIFARQLRREFGDRAAVLHSALSERERAAAWDRVRSGEALAVIGPRSAAFAPVVNPGLFVVDEEHDASYKQRESPRYDAREVVAIRAKAAGAALVFGSATPSVEAEHAARRGRLTKLVLSTRVDDRPLPQVTLVDLRRESATPAEKGIPLFSGPLLERLREVFSGASRPFSCSPGGGTRRSCSAASAATTFAARSAAWPEPCTTAALPSSATIAGSAAPGRRVVPSAGERSSKRSERAPNASPSGSPSSFPECRTRSSTETRRGAGVSRRSSKTCCPARSSA